MAAGALYDLARVVTGSIGTGSPINLGANAPGYLDFAAAGVPSLAVVSYGIIDGAASEKGSGLYTAGAPATLTRNVTSSTNSNNPINLSANAQIFICAGRQNILSFAEAMTWLTAAEKTQARANLYAAPFDAEAFNGMQINGDNGISQEFGATVKTLATGSPIFLTDMWTVYYQNAAAVVTAQQLPAASFPVALSGYSFGLQLKATTALSSLANGDVALIRNTVEGCRVARLWWGAAGARSLSYAFMVYCTGAGTLFVRVANATADRAYYVEHGVAIGWNFLTGTIPGDTSGTWNKTTSVGLFFDICVAGKAASPATPGAWTSAVVNQTTNSTNLLGTNNNVVIPTGLFLLPGIELPIQDDLPLIMRPYSTELSLCQRYYEVGGHGASGVFQNTTTAQVGWQYETPKRVAPTLALILTTPVITEPGVPADRTGTASTITFSDTSLTGSRVAINGFSGANGGAGGIMIGDYLAAAARI